MECRTFQLLTTELRDLSRVIQIKEELIEKETGKKAAPFGVNLLFTIQIHEFVWICIW